MFRYKLVGLAVCLATLSFSQKIPLIHSGKAIEQGKAAYDTGNYEAAISEFRSVPQRDTNYVYMLTELALAYTAHKAYDSALAVCKRGLMTPSAHKAHLLRSQAIATDKKGDFGQSIALFEKAIAQYPFDHGLVYNLGVTYYNHKDYDKAADCFFRTLAMNPFHGGSHYNLARLAIGSGHKTHAALALGIYMSVNPNDNNRLVLFDKLLSNQVEEEGAFPADFTNSCERLDQILRARIAMDKNFKTKVPLDFPVVRQMEMLFEQLASVVATPDDRWLRHYLPIYKAIKDQNFVEPYIYHILTSIDSDKVKKWQQKNDKFVKAFYTAANAEIAKPRALITPPAALGYSQPVAAEYNDNNQLDGLGPKDAAGKRQGQWYFYHENQELAAEGQYKDDEKTGIWKYYRNDHSSKSIENYETGEVTGYFADGSKRQHFFLKGDDIDGEVERFYPCGNLQEKQRYKLGKRDGPGQTYYANGQKELTYQYTGDIATGKYIRYYENGKLMRESEYNNDELTGPYIEYYANGKLRLSGSYVAEQEDGPWKYYYANGQLEKTGTYKNGAAIGEWTFYDMDGTVNEKRNFSADGKWHGDNTHYEKAKLFRRMVYKNDVLIRCTSYDETGKELASFGSDNGTFAVKLYAAAGHLAGEGAYQKGKMHGPWTYYYPQGSKLSEYTYKEGNIQGRAVEYFSNGQPQYISNYQDGVFDGYFQEFFIHGQVKQEGWFLAGDRQQRWLRYHANGTVESDYYYLNGSVVDLQQDYAVTGKPTLEVELRDEDIIGLRLYNNRGTVESVRRSKNNEDIYETKYPSGKLKSQTTVQCGHYTGNTTRWYPDGSTFSSYSLMTGHTHGPYRLFKPGGTQPLIEGQYLYGRPDGVWTWYDDNGQVETRGKYVAGDADSTWAFYNRDGKLSSLVPFKNDERHGIVKMFAPDGTTAIMEQRWDNGHLVAYRIAGSNGQPGEWQKLKDNTAISVSFPNGDKAFEEQYVKGLQEGLRRLYYPGGKLHSEYNYKSGDRHGPYKIYYASGKLHEKGEYKNDELTGTKEIYQEDGTLLKSETYICGSKEGKSTWYKNGKKVIEVEFFDNDPSN